MVSRYVPDFGDIVWLQFNPQAGHEQAGHRPALVLSPKAYNKMRGMMICCPMTSQTKGYPFEVIVSQSPASIVLSDQIKSVDWKARGAVHAGTVTKAVIDEVRAKVSALLGL
ncbi:PemK-like protein [Novosphingobium sp. Rr 2-17]|uniref:endoribonuclease MazF n=1 Tax=Novosphingobium sp. Rr 2-17 TaxID=555793 RepID=UPI0002699B7C|nr:endoribonuclease MazF [Novosphingobium sp. Rr 2-17]EIZ79813.1 PemK-like protein [Novosphingobium sp. Rr 2-17]